MVAGCRSIDPLYRLHARYVVMDFDSIGVAVGSSSSCGISPTLPLDLGTLVSGMLYGLGHWLGGWIRGRSTLWSI